MIVLEIGTNAGTIKEFKPRFTIDDGNIVHVLVGCCLVLDVRNICCLLLSYIGI